MEKIKTFEEICLICRKLQNDGKKIVFCHGIFDILHRGHVTLLAEAKKLGDILIVGIDHDDNAKILKGPKRPINDHQSRMFVLSQLSSVDFVFLIPSIKNISDLEKFYTDVIYKPLQPDIVTTSLKAGNFGEFKKREALAIGAKFVDIDHGIYDKKTTKIIEILGLD